jgi:hypothetical protein
MKLYTGIDLHSNNSYVVIIDETDKLVFEKRLPNDLEIILEQLSFYKNDVSLRLMCATY